MLAELTTKDLYTIPHTPNISIKTKVWKELRSTQYPFHLETTAQYPCISLSRYTPLAATSARRQEHDFYPPIIIDGQGKVHWKVTVGTDHRLDSLSTDKAARFLASIIDDACTPELTNATFPQVQRARAVS